MTMIPQHEVVAGWYSFHHGEYSDYDQRHVYSYIILSVCINDNENHIQSVDINAIKLSFSLESKSYRFVFVRVVVRRLCDDNDFSNNNHFVHICTHIRYQKAQDVQDSEQKHLTFVRENLTKTRRNVETLWP